MSSYFCVEDAVRDDHGGGEEVDDGHPGFQSQDGDDEEQVDDEGGGDEERIDHPRHDHLHRLLRLHLHLLLFEKGQAGVGRVGHPANVLECVADLEAVEDGGG